MLLVVDAGNSNLVVGLYDGETLASHWRLTTDHYRTTDELRILFTMLMQEDGYNPKRVDGCCISSVVPQLNHSLTQVAREGFKVDPVMVEPGIRTGIKLHNENPKELGADRLVNAVGALEVEAEQPGEVGSGGAEQPGGGSTGGAGGAEGGELAAGATAPGGSLPITGGDVLGLTLIGAAAVATGAVLVRRSRREHAADAA